LLRYGRPEAQRGRGGDLTEALCVDGPWGRVFDRALGQRPRERADEDLAGCRGLLQSRGEVHRGASHEQLVTGLGSGDDLAAVHPDPQL